MENDHIPFSRVLTRREAIALFGAAGVAMLTACYPKGDYEKPSVQTTGEPKPTTSQEPKTTPGLGLAGCKTIGLCAQEWQVQMARLDALEAQITGAPGNLPRKRTLLHLTRSLQQFGQGQFRFFDEGFLKELGQAFSSSPFPKLEIRQSNVPNSYSPDDVVCDVVRRITEDINLFQKAYVDRVSNTVVRDYLSQIDYLASRVLWSATGTHPDGFPYAGIEGREGPEVDSYKGDYEVKTILTYLSDGFMQEGQQQAFPTIRVLPYSQVAMIGIPFQSITDMSELFAIPHELGHFRFWYSYCTNYDPSLHRCTGGDERRNVRERMSYALPAAGNPIWQEEIFADMYALLLGGPLALLQAQNLALTHIGLGDFADFGNAINRPHPTPIIRPLIQLKALNNFGNTLLNQNTLNPSRAGVVDMMHERWLSLLASPPPPAPPTSFWDSTAVDFTDAAVRQRVSSLMSPGLGLTAGLPIDDQIQNALNALESIFLSTGAKERQDWGWASLIDAHEGTTWQTVADLEVMGSKVDALLKQAVVNPPNIEAFLDVPISYPYIASHSNIPPLWRDWGTTGKDYFSNSGLSSVRMDSGERIDMQNRTPDKWIRVFGSGGWSTEGPCSTRK